jgi:hypothetical protein
VNVQSRECLKSVRQLGNILTKALGRLRFLEMRSRIGMIDLGVEHNRVLDENVSNKSCVSVCVCVVFFT